MSLSLFEFTKAVRNEILHVHCTTHKAQRTTHNAQRTMHNAAIPFYKLLAGLNLRTPVNTRECFGLTDFWAALYFLSDAI
jgi:hypothetical protein